MNLGMPEMIFIFLLALIIFGPKKLPEIGRQLGKALTEFKRASNEFKMQIEDEIRQLEYEEQQKKIAAPATIDAAPAPSYAQSASAALVNASPEGTVAHGSDLHAGEVPQDLHNGEIPEEHGHAGESPASTQSAALRAATPDETSGSTQSHLTAQGSDV